MTKDSIPEKTPEIYGELRSITHLHRRVRALIQKEVTNESLAILRVRTSEQTWNFEIRVTRRRGSAIPRIVAVDGAACNALANEEAIMTFLKQHAGSDHFQLSLHDSVASHDRGLETQKKEPLVRVNTPEYRDPHVDTLTFTDLLRNVYRRFERIPLAILPLAVEFNGDVQGFIKVQKIGRRYMLVDDFLNRRVTLSRSTQDAVVAFIEKDFNVPAHQCVYRVASTEEKEAYEEAEEEALEEEGLLNEEKISEIDQSEQSAISGEKKKPKRQRPHNRPKKKTKAQIRAKEVRVANEEYTTITQETLRLVTDFTGHRIDTTQQSKLFFKLQNLGKLRGANRARLRHDLVYNQSFAQLRSLLLLFAHGRAVRTQSMPRKSRGLSFAGTDIYGSVRELNDVVTLAQELHSDLGGDRAHSAYTQMFTYQNDTRDIVDYAVLLFNTDPVSLAYDVGGVSSNETWVDIGSGRTPSNPSSLIRLMPILNPRIRMIGIDSSYSKEFAASADKVAGRVGLSFEGANECELKPGIAQDLPFENNSINKVLSSFAYDKFNDDEGVLGTQQALREVARVLQVGGVSLTSPQLLPVNCGMRVGCAMRISILFLKNNIIMMTLVERVRSMWRSC